MNSSVYIFGKLSSGYTQYPDDGSREIFQKFYSSAKATTQLCIRRSGNLIYYGYIRKLEGNQYIGLCVLLNDYLHKSLNKLFDLFENTFFQMVSKGLLIHYDEKGNIISTISHLYEHPEEIKLLASSLKGGFDQMDAYCSKLPPVDFSVTSDSVKQFSIRDDNYADILKSTYTNGYTIVYKSHDYQSEQLNSFSAKLAQSYKEKSELKNQVSELKSKVNKLQQQKRNTRWVGILAVATAILGLILWFKVINPAEVTNKRLNEYNYYGPMVDGEPHGVGVAVYHPGDEYGRKFYIGRFVNGKRQDDNAMLLYDSGDFFYGEMDEDHWVKGTFYYNSENNHFTGTFDEDNEPYTGTWYEHQRDYDIKEKKQTYDRK